MSYEPVVIENGAPGKKKEPKGILLAIAVVLLIFGLFAAGLFLIPWGKGETHEQYATGEVYEVSGYIVKADSWHVKGTRGTTLHCDIEIATDEGMPDGSHVYTSNYSGDFRTIEAYADKPEEHLTFTISEAGNIQYVRKFGEPLPWAKETAGKGSEAGNGDFDCGNVSDEEREKINTIRNRTR